MPASSDETGKKLGMWLFLYTEIILFGGLFLIYGGLIASLIDCHSTGTGSAALHKLLNESQKKETYPRCVTASLKVDYLKPTPIDCILELRGKVKEIKGRKVIVETSLYAKNEICAKGEVIVVQVPDDWKAK